MKAPYIPQRFLLASVAIAATGLVVSAGAATYKLAVLGSSGALTEYSDPANWLIDDVVATTCPGPNDTIVFGTASTQYHAYLALDGDYTIKEFKQGFNCPHLYKSQNAAADTVTFTITTTIGVGQYHYFFVNDGVRLVFPAGSTYNTAYWDGGASQMNVNDGGTTEIRGAVTSRHARYKIADGGTLIFAPTSYSASNFSGQYDSFTVANGGTLTFPNGLNVTGGNNSTQQINQNGGTITFGGSFTSIAPWTYTWNAGTLAITDDASFAANIALVIPASKAVTLDIASGKTFSATGLSSDPTSSITVTGGGTFSIAPTTAPIILQNGSLGLATAGTYDLSNVSLGSGAATITLTALGARVNSLPAALANATFTADLSTTTAGTVIFYSADSSVLSKVKADLAASVPQGFDLVISGEALSMEEVSDYIFNSTSVTDLLNASGWNTGSVPPANAAVAIDGANVVAEYTSGTLPAWTAIEVKNGATLRTSADVVLPAITLNKTATLDIAAGTASLANGLTGVTLVNGDNITLPVLSIQTNATLTIGGDMKFKNVDFRLYGKLSKSSTTVKGPTFGYAAGGETSYFAFTSDGGNFDIHSETGSDPTLGQLNFLCPESGGTVVAVGPITLRNSTHRINGWNDMGNVYFGNGNPMTEPFDVLIDNTKFDISGNFRADGAAHLTLANGSYIRRDVNCLGHGFNMAIGYAATVEIGEGCYIDFTTYNGAGSFGMDVQSAVDAVTVRDGGVYNVTYHSSGWGQGVFVADGGILGVSRIADSRVRTDLLRGFGSARLDGDLAIAALEMRTGGHFTNTVRQAKVANIPFTGTGNVIVTNGVPADPFSVTMVNGANTATGSIGVANVEGADTTLYFADGANWAGTVKANGDVKLVKSFAAVTDATADAPAAVSFGGVELLDDTFKLRLWEDGTCDTINIGANGWTGAGKLDFEFVGGFEPAAQAWKVATQPAAAALPAVKKATFALTTQASATEGFVDVYLKVANGVVILLR